MHFYDCDMMSGIDGLLHIAEALQVNLSLTKVSTLFLCKFVANKSNGIIGITKMLQMNKSLTHPDLSGNYHFSDSGAYWIFEAFKATLI